MRTRRPTSTRYGENANNENENGAEQRGVKETRRPLGEARAALADVSNVQNDTNNNNSKAIKPSRPQSGLGRSNQGPRGGRRQSRDATNDASEVAAVAPAPIRNSSSAVAPAPERSSAVAPVRARSARVPDDIDARDAREPLAQTEYVQDMYEYFRKQELENVVSATYMNPQHQPNVNARMRSILIDWLVEVHLKFKLVPDTLYLTVALIDKYLENETVTRANLQLVGVTAFLIAAKYEEIYPPEVTELVYITDRAYNRNQIQQMEESMLNTLEYKLTFPTTYCFLLRYLKAAHADKRIVQLSCYICERMLQEYSMLKFLPSTVAACAVYIARKNLNRNSWSPTLSRYTNYGEDDLRECLAEMSTFFNTRGGDLGAVYRKFSSAKFGSVATMNIQVLD